MTARPDRAALCVELFDAGLTLKAIAARVGITGQGVEYHLRHAGRDVHATLRARRQASLERFAAIWNAAATLAEAAMAAGVSRRTAVGRAIAARKAGLVVKRMPHGGWAVFKAR